MGLRADGGREWSQEMLEQAQKKREEGGEGVGGGMYLPYDQGKAVCAASRSTRTQHRQQ